MVKRTHGLCVARAYKRKSDVCGAPADTVRRVQAAPGLWVHVSLCHLHQHIWDEGSKWGGPDILRESTCGDACPFGYGSGQTHPQRYYKLEKGQRSLNYIIERDRSFLERSFANAVKQAIDAHGPITFKDNRGSAAKRIIGVLKNYAQTEEQ